MGGNGSGVKNKLGDVVRVTAWIPRETVEEIERIAQIAKCHKSDVIRITLDNYVKEAAMAVMILMEAK